MPPTEVTPTAQVDPAPRAGDRRQAPLPWWVRTLDVLAGLIVAAALSVAIFGGFRTRLLGVMISAHSSLRLLVIAAVLVTARHYVRRSPSVAARLSGAVARFRRAESVLSRR